MLLKEIAYEKIKEKILNEEYVPGEVLSERTLINDLEMSKTPIKNALTLLEGEGFLKVSSKQGIFILDMSFEKINDTYDLRIALETFNCKILYPRITEQQINELEHILIETKKHTDQLDIQGFATYDHQFHLAISKMAGNKEITDILINRQNNLRRITLRHLRKNPERVQKFYEEHLEILNAFKSQSDSCIELMNRHLDESKSILYQ
jgi:DNA-binding GntR family transcriptional regulator